MTDNLVDPSHPSFSYETSPQLFLFTSLTAGSSHIITATSRLETILKANRIPFLAIDCATDEKARRIWSRRAGTRKYPGLVREGTILADLETVEEWNEYGELKDMLKPDSDSLADASTPAAKENVPVAPPRTTTLPIREQLPSQSMSPSSKPILDAATIRSISTSTRPPSEDAASPRDPALLFNTSPTASLPPLSIPSSPAAVKSGADAGTPSLPNAPPSTAFPDMLSPRSPSDSSKDRFSAAPSIKRGLDAVTAHPELSDAAIAARHVRDDRGRSVSRGRAEEMKKTESEGGSSRTASGGVRVTFENDQRKGDARDGKKAEESIGD